MGNRSSNASNKLTVEVLQKTLSLDEMEAAKALDEFASAQLTTMAKLQAHASFVHEDENNNIVAQGNLEVAKLNDKRLRAIFDFGKVALGTETIAKL